jgi:rhodanese-related sulfurtransferase
MRSFFIITLGLISLITSCTKSASPPTQVSPQEVQGLLRNDFAVLVDVREQNELQEGMAAPAQWIALSQIQKKAPEWQAFLQKTPKGKQVVLYCSNPECSLEGAKAFAAEGYKTGTLANYQEWVKAGLPTRKP